MLKMQLHVGKFDPKLYTAATERKRDSVWTCWNAFLNAESKHTSLDVAVHGRGLGSSDQPLQLSPAEVLGLDGQLLNVHIAGQQLELAHLGRVDVEDLDAAVLIRQPWETGRRRPQKTE